MSTYKNELQKIKALETEKNKFTTAENKETEKYYTCKYAIT